MGCQQYTRCIENFNRNDDTITDPYSDSSVTNKEFKVSRLRSQIISKKL